MTAQESPPHDGPAPERPRAVAGNPWAWPILWGASLLMLLGAGLYVFKSCRDLPGEALDKTGLLVNQIGQQVQKVAAAFKQGSISTTFTSYATTVSGSQYLQFATLSQTEVFTRKDESTVFWGRLPLPDVIVEATAPVTYTYYLDLNARWDFVLQDGVILVTAPAIKFNKPAVDASRITYVVRKDSHFRNTTEAMENLKNSITWLSYQKAHTNLALVRETGRHQTEMFVRNWLARSFTDGKRYPVQVRFRDEVPEAGVGVLKPTEEPGVK